VVADHGSVSQAYPYHYANATLAVVFSGNHQKADDVLAQYVGFGQEATTTTTTIMVVTADTELKSRCQRTVSKTSALHNNNNQRGIYFLDPTTFLDDLDAVDALRKQQQQETTGDGSMSKPLDHNSNTDPQVLSLEDQQQLEELEEEIQLRALVLDTKVQLDHHRGRGKLKKKGTMTNKRRKKLLSNLDILQTKLAQRRGPSLLKLVTSMDNDDGRTMTTTMTTRTRHPHQELIMKRWKHMQRHRKEQTGDRVVLAEHLRRQLEEMEFADNGNVARTRMDGPAIAFIQHFNKLNNHHAPGAVSTREQIASASVFEAATHSTPSKTKQRATVDTKIVGRRQF
jgi:hypothetical protein